MKTRMQLWKDYRKEINSNIKLQKAVSLSDEKLAILNKRLLEVFPNYNKKYDFNLDAKELSFENEMPSQDYFSTKKIDDLLNQIEKSNIIGKSFNSIDKIDFSSHDLDEVILEMKQNSENETAYKALQSLAKANAITKKYVQKIQVAIDGPSGSGKSTIAKIISKKYQLKYINTGLFYRAIALNAIENNANLNNESEVFNTLEKDMIKLEKNEVFLLKNVDVTKKLRTNEISQAASKISVHPKVRAWAVAIQKKYAKEEKVIMDGRDTTFNIMPHANVKIFLETTSKERARRRAKENKKRGFNDNFEEILKEIKERDERDYNRKLDPLHKTKDAHAIDSTNLTINEVTEVISQIIERTINNE